MLALQLLVLKAAGRLTPQFSVGDKLVKCPTAPNGDPARRQVSGLALACEQHAEANESSSVRASATH
jgi:hypothetical protein